MAKPSKSIKALKTKQKRDRPAKDGKANKQVKKNRASCFQLAQ